MPKKFDPAVGIRYSGEVLEGKKSVELALKEDGQKAVTQERMEGEFARPEDYDAVLRAHCRFPKE